MTSAPTLTPTSARKRAVLRWSTLGVLILLVAGLTAWLSAVTQQQDKGALHPENHGPDGFNALTTVLREHGVDVRLTTSWEDARDGSDGATLVFVDAPALSDTATDALLASGRDVVLLEPRSRTLARGFDATFGGRDTSSDTGCALAPDVRALSEAQLYTGAASDCFPGSAGSDGSAVIVATRDDHTVTAVDAASLFTNGTITEADNAALALTLLGRNDTLVWYLPSAADTDRGAGDASLADLTPPWVTPVIVLGLLTAIAAAVWRGRRFGPLVAERLPVTVRASEALEGRARLYARSRDTAHAARVLRRTSAAAIGARLGLGRRAPVSAVADAAAVALGAPVERVTAILAGPAPTTDAALLQLSDSLTRLEAAIGAAVRAEGKRP